MPARGAVIKAETIMPVSPVRLQLMASNIPTCAAIAPMVMAKLMPIPDTMGMIRLRMINRLRTTRLIIW